MSPPPIYLGLGANLGDRLANLRRGVRRLNQRDIHPVRSSRVYETEPVGPPQPAYLNAVIEVAGELDPRSLLHECLEVEESLGRVRTEPLGPRTLDIDILAFGDREIDEPGLVVPHPRAHQRAFVLVPWLELEPDPLLAGGRRIATLRLPPGALDAVRPIAPPLL